MNMKPGRVNCQQCGRPIYLVKTEKGKTLPCDREEVHFIIGGTESRRFVRQNGEVFRGELAGGSEQEFDVIVGWACHYDTCPAKQGGIPWKKRRTNR